MFTCQLRVDLSESYFAAGRAGGGAADGGGDAVEEFAVLYQAQTGSGAVGVDVEFCAAVQGGLHDRGGEGAGAVAGIVDGDL